MPSEESFDYAVHFCGQDDCQAALSGLLEAANWSVECAFYSLDGSIVEGLHRSATNRVNVSIIVDSGARVDPRYSDSGLVLRRNPAGIMHNKYCVIDGRTVITGSFNPTKAARQDDNNLLVINSTTLAGFYHADFKRLKSNMKTGKSLPGKVLLNGSLVEVHFCPRDYCAAALQLELAKAGSSIVFATYSFTHQTLANELILKRAGGVNVSGIIEKSTTGNKASKHSMLEENGIDVLIERSKGLMHHKFFVVDNETVVTGSFNPTENADRRNDENLIIIRNVQIAAIYAAEFNRILPSEDDLPRQG